MHIRDFVGRHVHFIGIGGVSMSGLASILRQRGYTVSGSDMNESAVLDRLRAQGITCYAGHKAGQEAGAALIIYNAAIPASNPERAAADAAGIPSMDRAELLGQLMESYQQSICVAGTHGKTSTSSMLATVLELAHADPTVHIGGDLALIGGPVKLGSPDLFVSEACEYKDSFLQFHPTCAIVLNIDADHLDYFKDIDAIQASFEKFLALLPEDGLVIGNGDDARVRELMASCGRTALSYGYDPACTYHAENVHLVDGCYAFDLYEGTTFCCPVQLGVPGRHNVLNAMAALAAAKYAGVDLAEAARFMPEYKGAGRRFEKAGMIHGAAVYHDYAHHPTEVRATLSAARDMCKGRLWCVFQPHTYSRTIKLYDQFTEAFDEADALILLDIYAAREKDPGTVSSAQLAEAIDQREAHELVAYAPDFAHCAALIRESVQPGDLVLTLGAGDVAGVSRLICE